MSDPGKLLIFFIILQKKNDVIIDALDQRISSPNKGIEPDMIYTYPSIVLQLRRPQAPHLFTLAGAVWSGSRPSARPIVHNRRQFGANY